MSLNQGDIKKKLIIFLLVISLLFLILAGRLFYLQILIADDFRTQSEENRIRIITKEARRGDILSADGSIVATSTPVFSISIAHLVNSNQRQTTIDNLIEILEDPEINEEVIQEKLQKNTRKFEPVQITTLPWDEHGIRIVTQIEERVNDFLGVVIEEAPQRYYPFGDLGGHILGYTGLINQRELESFKDYGYDASHKIGKVGIEKAAEIRNIDGEVIGLKGIDGTQQVEVNAVNRPVREIMNIPSTPGDNVVLTINFKLQQALENALDEAIAIALEENQKAGTGSGVVIDVNTGAILAMASKPGINPNDFVDGTFNEKRDYYNDPILNPQLNRAIKATYPPGSTFKMITLIAALETQAVSLTETVNCTGAYWRPPYISCNGVHGNVDFHRALAVSCNTYVQHVAHLTGIDSIAAVAAQFGLGSRTGSPDLIGEEAGLLPTPEWKMEISSLLMQRRYERQKDEIERTYQTLRGEAETLEDIQEVERQRNRELADLERQYKIDFNFETTWHAYDTYNTSIGQGASSYTVLQLANYTAAIASKGTRYVPYLIDKIVSSGGDVLIDYQPQIAQIAAVSEHTMEHVIEGMHDATKPGGTAYYLFYDFPREVTIAAKTGTAQTGRVDDDRRGDYHGVFVAFAPVDNPQIAFAGLVEYAQTGGSVGQVAKAIFEEYFNLKEEHN